MYIELYKLTELTKVEMLDIWKIKSILLIQQYISTDRQRGGGGGGFQGSIKMDIEIRGRNLDQIIKMVKKKAGGGYKIMK